MKWHLLNQLYVNLDYRNSKLSVLEDLVSSELQYLSLLVSGVISFRTMSLVLQEDSNRTEHTVGCLI